jgi:hypothetical protein
MSNTLSPNPAAVTLPSYEDFAMPPTFALVSSVDSYGTQLARVYTPNPWHPSGVRIQDWKLYGDGIWRRTLGCYSLEIAQARTDWKSLRSKGYAPRDVIANPFNGSRLASWDEWASHFAGDEMTFCELLTSHGDYPRKPRS